MLVPAGIHRVDGESIERLGPLRWHAESWLRAEAERVWGTRLAEDPDAARWLDLAGRWRAAKAVLSTLGPLEEVLSSVFARVARRAEDDIKALGFPGIPIAVEHAIAEALPFLDLADQFAGDYERKAPA